MSQFWNEKFDTPDYIYGKQPNAWFKECVDKLKAGKILVPGSGEGRDAVYAAINGWQVTAFDSSSVAKQKAEQLAQENGVSIDYSVCDVRDFEAAPETFDAVGITFFHLPPDLRKQFHKKVVESLKPGAAIFMEMFTPEQLNNQSGGPKSVELLYDVDMLTDDFMELTSFQVTLEEITLDEGPLHQGKANVVRLYGIK